MSIHNVRMISGLSIVFSKTYNPHICSVTKVCSIFYGHHAKHSFSNNEKEEKLQNLLNINDFECHRKTFIKNIDFEKICKGNPQVLQKLKIFELEIEILAQKGGKVPETITTNQWKKLLSFTNSTSKRRYIYFLWLNEKRNCNMRQRKALSYHEYLQFIKPKSEKRKHEKLSTNSPIEYGLMSNSLFLRISDKQINNFYNYKLTQASIFGPHLCIDCGYESYMTSKQVSFIANEIVLAWSKNREHFHPHNLTFCNLNRKGKLFNIISGRIPNIIEDPDFPFFHTEGSYLDLFPAKQLVYLTPYSKQEMKCYDPHNVYVIGALSGQSMDHHLLLAKAKRDGLHMAKFPINYGRRILTITENVNILNDVKDGSNWSNAFRHISQLKTGENA